MNSRSEMRRLAVQNPDALIKEIERLRNVNDQLRELISLCRDRLDGAEESTKLWALVDNALGGESGRI